MNNPRQLGRGSRRASPASTARSAQFTRGRVTRRRSTATSWRSISSSASLAAELGVSSASHPSPDKTADTAVVGSSADHRGPIASSTNPQLSAHNRLTGTHKPAWQSAAPDDIDPVLIKDEVTPACTGTRMGFDDHSRNCTGKKHPTPPKRPLVPCLTNAFPRRDETG
jgi:hypothetical protein